MRRFALLLLLLLLWPLPGGAKERAPRERARSVLVLGLDGANWALLDPLIASGRIPRLASIVKRSARFGLTCAEADRGTACYCPPVWNSIFTGRPASQHHILALGQLASERRGKTIWSVLHDYGGTSTGLALRNTWPVEPDLDLNFTQEGLDFAADQIFERWGAPANPRMQYEQYRTSPPGLFEALGMLPHVGPRVPVWDQYARDRITMMAMLRLPPAARTDLTFVLLHGTDKAEHLHWNDVQPTPGAPIDGKAIADLAAFYTGPVSGPAPWSFGTVTSSYQEADAWLKRLLKRVHYDYIVLVSDHGMGRSPDPGLAGQHDGRVPEAHVGIFAVWGPGVQPHVGGLASVLDVAPTLAHLLGMPVGSDLPGHVVEQVFRRAWRHEHPIARVPSWELPPAPGASRRLD